MALIQLSINESENNIMLKNWEKELSINSKHRLDGLAL